MRWIIGTAALGITLLLGIVTGSMVTAARMAPLDSASAIAVLPPSTDIAVTTLTATQGATRTVVATRTAVATRTETATAVVTRTATATATRTETETATADPSPSAVVETISVTRPNRHGRGNE